MRSNDIGLHLAQRGSRIRRAIGTGIVKVMPKVFTILTVIGTAAMLWVGGNILTHGLHAMGVHGPYEWIHEMATSVANAIGHARDVAAWVVTAALDGLIGLCVGAVIVPLVNRVQRFRAASRPQETRP